MFLFLRSSHLSLSLVFVAKHSTRPTVCTIHTRRTSRVPLILFYEAAAACTRLSSSSLFSPAINFPSQSSSARRHVPRVICLLSFICSRFNLLDVRESDLQITAIGPSLDDQTTFAIARERRNVRRDADAGFAVRFSIE